MLTIKLGVKYREKICIPFFHYFRVLKSSLGTKDISVLAEDNLVCMRNPGIDADDGLQPY